MIAKGTAATRDFYDREGWRRQNNGLLSDTILFQWEAGPIHETLDTQRKERILKMVGYGQRLAELGCGGSPAMFLTGRCAKYTAVDFSVTGLSEAAVALEKTGVPFETVEADITDLPFGDGLFDVVYSAQAIYHIDTADGQASAFQEAMRITRPGGRAIFVLGNPFPLMFPYRLLRRVLAMTPGLSALLNRLRAKPPLPYLPMPLGWMRRQLQPWGDVEITGYAMPSVPFDRRFPEKSILGQCIWRTIQWIETHHPKAAAWLGCYVLIVVDKQP